jgi:transcriptional regulator of acetoin/glycerol metabolism
LVDPAHRQAIEASRARCLALGLADDAAPAIFLPDNADLRLLHERNARLIEHAAPVMEMLREQMVCAHSVIVLSDGHGTIVHSIGDAEFLERAKRVALKPGINWAEGAKGTNAIGTALIDEAPTVVHGSEHFLRANHFLTCSAAPIFDPRGDLLGVLDVTGDQRSYHQHTLGLVKLSARLIENTWFSDSFRAALRLRFHHRADALGTLDEGVLALSEGGMVLGANRQASRLLGLSSAALRRLAFERLFDCPLAALFDHARAWPQRPLALRGAGGAVYFVLAGAPPPAAGGGGWPRPQAVDAPTALPAAAARAPAPRDDPFCGLEGGDERLAPLLAALRRAAGQPGLPVLLAGARGSGRRRWARALHRASAGDAPLVELDFAGLDEAAQVARIDAALAGAGEAGSLLLAGVASMTAAARARLAQRLGRRRALLLLEAGAMLADDWPLELRGLRIDLPALAERRDLDALLVAAWRTACGDAAGHIDAAALNRLRRHRWTAGFDELARVMQIAAAGSGASLLLPGHLPDWVAAEGVAGAAASPALGAAASPAPGAAPTASAPLRARERAIIDDALRAAGGNVAQAARRLGISRNRVYRALARARGGDAEGTP